MRSVSRGRRTGRLELLLSAREVGIFYSLNKVGGNNSQTHKGNIFINNADMRIFDPSTSQQIKYVNSLISNPPLLHLRLTAGPVLTAPQFSWAEPALSSVLESTKLQATPRPTLPTDLFTTGQTYWTDISFGIQLIKDGRSGRTKSLSALRFTPPLVRWEVGEIRAPRQYCLVQTPALPVSPGKVPGSMASLWSASNLQQNKIITLSLIHYLSILFYSTNEASQALVHRLHCMF